MPRSVAKYIRLEKARIRRTVPDQVARDRDVQTLMERCEIYRKHYGSKVRTESK